jgi:hypothetical protein
MMDYAEFDAIVSRQKAMQRMVAREWDENERRLAVRDLEQLADAYDDARCRISQAQALLNEGAGDTYFGRDMSRQSTT